MKTCSRSPLLMLTLVYFTLPVLEAQEVRVSPEVTGYLGYEVTLPCQFIQGQDATINQVEWDFLPPEGQKFTILIASLQFGVKIPDSPLKERLEIAAQSLIIKDVEMADAGSYTCSIATFPTGSFEGTTNLVVKEQTEQMLPRLIAVGVFLLIVVTMLATTHVIIIRIRRKASVKHHDCTETGGPVMCD